MAPTCEQGSSARTDCGQARNSRTGVAHRATSGPARSPERSMRRSAGTPLPPLASSFGVRGTAAIGGRESLALSDYSTPSGSSYLRTVAPTPHTRHCIPLSRRNNRVGGMLRVPPIRHEDFGCARRTARRNAGPFAFWSPVPGPRQPQPVIGRFLAGLRSGERAALGIRSESGRRADGEPDGDRQLGSSQAADWRLLREGGSRDRHWNGDATTAADRDRCGARG